MSREDYNFILQNAHHYVALGYEEFYLDPDDITHPWHLVTLIAESGTYGDFITSVAVNAYDPVNKFKFRWRVDIKDGSDKYYEYKYDVINMLFKKLPATIKPQFNDIIKKCIAGLDTAKDHILRSEIIINDALDNLSKLTGAKVGNTTITKKI